MRRVDLKPMEKKKYKIIKSLVDNNGNKLRASIKLGVTIRTINRLILVYKTAGKQGFIHKNRGLKPKHALSESIKAEIIDLYTNKYYDFNFNHFLDKLKDDEGINISYNTLYNLLNKHLFLSPKAQKRTKKAHRKRIKAKLKSQEKLKLIEEKLIVENNILDPKSSHARIPRKKYIGEQLQMDASEHLWFGNVKVHLHGAIDDASGMIMGLYFDHQETLNGYYNVLQQCLTNHGIPYEFLTDRRTVFEYKSKKNPQPEYDTLTQFGYACEQLGINLVTTSIPQAKGRIERLFGTLQSRLINELRLNNISSIDQANEFLKTFIVDYNNRFSLINNNIPHVLVNLNENDDINLILAVVSSRKFDSGSSLKYKNNYYQAYNQGGFKINFKNKTKAVIIEAFNKKLYTLVDGKHYKLIKLPTHEKHSKNFDQGTKEATIDKQKYKVPMSHPWKQASYEAYLRKTGNL